MKNLLLQIDTDTAASTFDGVVAFDAGVDQIMTRGGVTPDEVTSLVHGMMFTRGPEQLRHSAIFVGGSDVSAAEALLSKVREIFFGPVRVSVLLDANGCNTTAAAAVVTAAKHAELKDSKVVVLGGTGPVGRRSAQMAAMDGAEVVLTSRNADRANTVADEVAALCQSNVRIRGAGTGDEDATRSVLSDANVVIACGAAGVQLASLDMLDQAQQLRVAIDLNAVPPAGLGGISVTDKNVKISDHAVGYGAIGVGGRKMKIHKSAIKRLFESNDQIMDAAEVFEIAKAL